MADARIAFDSRMWKAQDLSFNPHIAEAAMMETSLACMLYGFATSGKLKVYADDNETAIALDKIYADGVSLGLGIFTINLPHSAPCTRLICNCKTC